MATFKNKFILFSSIAGIILMYILLAPMGDGFFELSKNDYSFETNNVSEDNKWAKFEDEGNGRFFTHPGEKKRVEGTFGFNKDGNVLLKFSIQEDGKAGDIEYSINSNSTEFKKFVVTQDKKHTELLNILADDWISITADKHGDINQDLGNIEIFMQDKSFLFQQYIIPFLWIILFIFLYGKNHTLIAINGYFIFCLILLAEKLNFGSLPFRTAITYSLITMTMVFLFTLIYQELARKKFKIATILSYSLAFSLYVIPMIFIIYALAFNTKVTENVLNAILQSSSSESLEFIYQFISLKWIILFASTTTIIGFLLYHQEKIETEKIKKSLLIFIITMFGTLSFTYEADLRLFKFIEYKIKKYTRNVALFKEIQAKRKAGEIIFKAEKNEKNEIYIVIIGESLNKEHMGIYGYQRDTTPLLSKKVQENGLLVFDNVYSNAVETMPTLSLALTEANQLNKKNYYESLSIVNILNQTDTETYWVTNQQLQGIWDNLVSVIAHESDNLVGLNYAIGKLEQTSNYDGATIEEVKKILAEKSNQKNKIIFVHLMGSHAGYCARFPEENIVYKNPLAQGIFGKNLEKKGNIINCYDNSVLYNDFVVSSLLTELQKIKGVSGFLYFSDHAEDVFREFGHNSGQFTFDMTQIPMIAWFSDEYQKRYAEKYKTLKSHLHTLYSNDLIYNTLIGMFNIKTDRYNSLYDFTSKEYKLAEKDAYTMHREKRYTDKSNYIWWQKKNAQYLIDHNLSSRVFPYRVNSIGKLKDIWQDGFRSFEIDIHFRDSNTGFFQMGNSNDAMGESLETFLSSVEYSEIERVRVNFKNLNENNYKDAIKRLNDLDQKFQIKSKFIIESKTTDPFFKYFKQDGWHTSYCIPSETIVKMLSEENTKEMKLLAEKIAQQSRDQDLSALSFENELYSFIKEYLEPLISENIVYHTSYGPALYSNTFEDELTKNELFLDERVNTILVKYKSLYEL